MDRTIRVEEATRVFISYARENSDIAEEIHARLAKARFEVLIDKESIAPGEPWQERLYKLIRRADKVVILVSTYSLDSQVCLWERQEAQRQGKSILPVLLTKITVEDLPDDVKQLNLIFARDLDERRLAFETLVQTLPVDLPWEREKSRINDLAETWNAKGRPARLLVLRDDAIRAMEHWRDSQARNAEPPAPYQLAYITECRSTYTRRQRRIWMGLSVVALALAGSLILALIQRQVAVRNLAEAEAVTGFLDESFAAVNPRHRGRDIRFAEIMDEASQKLNGGQITLRRTAEARLRDTIGWSYLQMGVYQAAKVHLAKALTIREQELGKRAELTTRSLYRMALVKWHLNEIDEVKPLYLEALERQRAVLGDGHPEVALTLSDLGWFAMLESDFGKAENYYKEALSIHENLSHDELVIGDHAEALNNYGVLKQEQANAAQSEDRRVSLLADAEDLIRESITLRDGGGAPPSDLGESYANLAGLLADLRRDDEIEALYIEAIDLQSQHFGRDNYRTLISRGNLARYYVDIERYEIAVDMYRQQLDAWEKVAGDNQPHARSAMISLGATLVILDRHAEALEYLDQAVALATEANGPDHEETRLAIEWRDGARDLLEQE